MAADMINSIIVRRRPSLWAAGVSSNNIILQLNLKKSQFHSSIRFNQDCKQHISCNVSSSSSATYSPKEIPHPPSLWNGDADDDSFSSENDQAEQEEYVLKEEIARLKEEVRNRLLTSTENRDPIKDQLMLIDTLERTGVAYHFEEEIELQLKRIIKFYAKDDDGDRDVFTTALYFRLLRQHGYDVHCSVFDKFKDDEDDTFKKIPCNDDIEGLLNLYEASFVRFREENILQVARDYARQCLNEATPHLLEETYLKKKVNRALQQPLHMAPPKVEARYYISIYETKESKDEAILRLAKLDFHMLQQLYTKELRHCIKWLHGFDNLLPKLQYARKTVMQCYFWAAGLSYEPQYSLSRINAAKTLLMCVFLNDTYETSPLEELDLFTEIILSWDTSIERINKLPDNMKIIYEALLSTFAEFESEAPEKSYLVNYIKESMKQQVWAFYTKSKWYIGKTHFPTFQEHIDDVGVHINGVTQMLPAFYMHMGPSASKEAFDWVVRMPKIVEQASLYTRYMNDIGSYDREHESGIQYPNAIDCYMIENGLSKQDTMKKFAEFAEGSWMTVNREWINESKCVAKDILKPVVNAARTSFASYRQGLDGFTYLEGELYNHIDALLEPITI